MFFIHVIPSIGDDGVVDDAPLIIHYQTQFTFATG